MTTIARQFGTPPLNFASRQVKQSLSGRVGRGSTFNVALLSRDGCDSSLSPTLPLKLSLLAPTFHLPREFERQRNGEMTVRDGTDAKWSTDQIMMFLEMYSTYDVLWDIRNTNYSSKLIRDANLEDLRIKLNAVGIHAPTMEFLRKKIKNLKTVYRQEIAKIEKSKKNGAGVDDVYRPRLVWFSTADAFLHNVIKTRSTTLNSVSIMSLFKPICYLNLNYLFIVNDDLIDFYR